MAQPQRRQNFKLLVVLVLAALLYGGVINTNHSLTGMTRIDGIIGALLGLYICSQGAANILDVLLFGGASGIQGLSRRALIVWLALNGLILFVGWIVIVIGTTRFTLPS